MSIGGKGPGGRIRKMICSLFVLFAAVSPLRDMELGEFWELPQSLYQEGKDIGASAQEDVNEAVSEVIIQRTQAYILDEADSLNAKIQVSRLDLDPGTLVPVRVTLTGNVSPYQRKILSDYIHDTLGIGEEGLVWKD